METITFNILILATLLTIIYVYFHYNNCIDYFVSVNGDEYVDINDIKTDNKIMVVLRNMLRDTNNILKLHNIQYWIDGGTLLGAVRHHDIIPWDDDADICILEDDEKRFLALKPIFYSAGYDIAKWWGGYKIYPLNGINIKYVNNITNKDNDKEYYNYKYPFIDVMFAKRIKTSDGNIYHLADKVAREKWNNYFHYDKDLFPLKEYNFNTFTLIGPNNPYPYLDRAYNNWQKIGYKGYDHQHEKNFKSIEFHLDNNDIKINK